MPPGDATTNQLLEQLITKQEANNEALLRVSEHSEQTNKSIHGLDRTFAPLKAVTGIITKLLTATIGNAIKFDKMAVANADMNINLKHMQHAIVKMDSRIGTITDHTEVGIQLHRVGYKKLDKDFQDSLVLLNKQGGQGDELISFMGELLSKGASQKTQLAVAKAIAKVADNTTTTATAAIASLSEIADLNPLFKAMGFGGQTLEHLAKNVENMTVEGGAAMGKMLKSLMDDHGPLFWITGGREIANAIFNAKSQKQFDTGVKNLLEVSTEITKFGKMWGQDVVMAKNFDEQMFGAYAKTIMIAKEADAVRQSNTEDEIRNTEKYIKGSEAYNKSLTTAFDLVTKVGEVGGIALLDAISPLVTALTKFAQQYLSDSNLFEQIVGMGQSIGDWGGQITDWLTVLRSSPFYGWVSGKMTWYEAIKDRGKVQDFASKLTEAGGVGEGIEFKDYQVLLRGFGRDVQRGKGAGFLDPMEDLHGMNKEEYQRVREIAMQGEGGKATIKPAEFLGPAAEMMMGTSKSGLRVATGEGAGPVIRFSEAINDSKKSIEEYLQQVGKFDQYQRMIESGEWFLTERKVGNQTDFELRSKTAATAESRTEAERRGFIPAMEMSPEDFIRKLSETLWEQFVAGRISAPGRESVLNSLFMGG